MKIDIYVNYYQFIDLSLSVSKVEMIHPRDSHNPYKVIHATNFSRRYSAEYLDCFEQFLVQNEINDHSQ